MRFLRFFVDLQPLALFRRALARHYTLVPNALQRPFSASCRYVFALSFTQLLEDLHRLFAPTRHATSSFIGTKLPEAFPIKAGDFSRTCPARFMPLAMIK
jgi:hypothetical protein